jgi:hypothetical protein
MQWPSVLNYDNRSTYILRRRMWTWLFPRTPPFPYASQVPFSYLLFSPPSLRFHRPVRSYQAVPTFFLSPLSLLLLPLAPFFFFFGFLDCCGPGKKKKGTGRTLCIVVFGLLLPASSFSSPSSCLIGISHLRHASPRGPPPRSRRPPQPPPILSLGVAPRPAIDSDLAILSWANGRSHPKIKRSSRLRLGSAWVGRTGVGPPSGPRSSRRARDLIMCPCTSFFSRKRIKRNKKT